MLERLNIRNEKLSINWLNDFNILQWSYADF